MADRRRSIQHFLVFKMRWHCDWILNIFWKSGNTHFPCSNCIFILWVLWIERTTILLIFQWYTLYNNYIKQVTSIYQQQNVYCPHNPKMSKDNARAYSFKKTRREFLFSSRVFDWILKDSTGAWSNIHFRWGHIFDFSLTAHMNEVGNHYSRSFSAPIFSSSGVQKGIFYRVTSDPGHFGARPFRR